MNLKLIEYIEETLKKYVTIDKFSPVEKLVYGAAAIILTAMLVGLISFIIKR